MASAVQTPMTPEEFLAWEKGQDLRWEFDGSRPVGMNGGTVEHSIIQGDLLASLNLRLRGLPCRPHGPSMKVATAAGRYRYPDAFVTCTPVAARQTVIDEPVVIFEILSDGTERMARTEKLTEYRLIASLRRYVMVEQTEAFLTVITRTDHGWSIDALREADTLLLPEIGIELPVAELYLDVELPPAPG